MNKDIVYKKVSSTISGNTNTHPKGNVVAQQRSKSQANDTRNGKDQEKKSFLSKKPGWSFW